MDESLDFQNQGQPHTEAPSPDPVTAAFSEIAQGADRVIAALSYPQRIALPKWQQTLSYLAFEAAGTRLGIEIGVCIGMFSALSFLSPPSFVPAEWWSLVSWFIACTVIAVIDHLIFVPPVLIFYKALGLYALRKPSEALSALDAVGPDSARIIRYPRHLFHLWRSALFTSSEAFDLAAHELLLAQAAGGTTRDLAVGRIELLRSSGRYQEAISLCNSSPYLQPGEAKFEEALTRFDCALATGQYYVEASENRAALKQFEELFVMPDALLRNGLYTREASQAFAHACRLWTGNAEDAYSELTTVLQILGNSISVCPPISLAISRLYLARSLYSLTHKDPEQAGLDLRITDALNLPPQLRKLAERISTDLAARPAIA